MAKSCVKINSVTGSSESHNNREIDPKYLIKNEVPNLHIVDAKIEDVRKRIEEKYLKSVGQKMQAKATPIREAIILLPDNDNYKNIQNIISLNDELKERYGIEAFQVHIHNDEGHIDIDGIAKYNYHAHVIYNWTDQDTGKSLKIGKEAWSEIQTLAAKHLEMERGEKGSKSVSLNHHEYRGFMKIKEEVVKDLKIQLTAKIELEIRNKIIENRPEKQKNLKNERDEENNRRNKGGIIR